MIQFNFQTPEVKNFVVQHSKVKRLEKRQIKQQGKIEQQNKKRTSELMKQALVAQQDNKPKIIDHKMRCMQFILNCYDYRDFVKKEEEKKKKQEKDRLQEEEEEIEIIKKTDFLNPAEYQEIKDVYSDYNIGEYVIKFPNPDFSEFKDKPVTLREAEKVFDDHLSVIAEGGVSQSFLMIQRQSFLQAFMCLDDYVETDPYKIREMQIAQEKKNKSKNSNNILNFGKTLFAGIGLNQNKQQRKQKLLEDYKYVFSNFKKVFKKAPPPEPEHQAKHDKSGNSPSKKVSQSNIKVPQTEGEPIKLDEVIPNQDDAYNSIQSQYEQVIRQMQELNLSKSKVYKTIQKRYSQGGFLYKLLSEDKTDWDWIQLGQQPTDFLTLIRHTIILKLTRDAHFHCRQFISSDDKYIYLVIKSKQQAILRFAEQSRYFKQYELGYADLFSLEPCDKKLRPLRLKNYIRDPEFQQKAHEFVDLQKEIKNKNLDRIENCAQKFYQAAMKMGEKELRGNIVLNEKKLDSVIKGIASDLKISLNHEKQTIVDDVSEPRETWEAYYVYQEYLIDFFDRIEKTKEVDKKTNKHKELDEIKKNKGFLYKLIFRKALGDANELYAHFNKSIFFCFNNDKVLYNLWDRQGLRAVAPFGQFFVLSENESQWRQFEVSEKGNRSEFMNMEKLKIANALMQKHINLKKLIENEFIDSFFALHDPYQLLGLPKAGMIKPLIDLQMISERKETPGQQKLKDLFIALKDEAEGSDFDGDSLADETAFKYMPPWQLNIESLRDYFGEKIALYFKFLVFYTKSLWNVVVISIICEGVIDNTSGQSKYAFLVIFSLVIIVFSSYFTAYWKRHQVLFQIEYGMQKESEGNQVERPAFEGKFIRSIITDKLNEEIYDGWMKQTQLGFSGLITLLMICLVVGSIIGVFILKGFLMEEKYNDFISSFLPSLLNAIIINIFNYLYGNLSTYLNHNENHKYESEYENSLIIKTFFFTFINTFNCLAIIAFLNGSFPNLNLCTTPSGINCYKALQNQMITIFMVNFAKIIPQLIVPCLKNYWRSETKTVDENMVQHEFMEIDQFIENQGDMEPYESNAEVDGLMNDYMELVVQFCFLQLFGLAFPLAYLVAFLTNVAQIHVDKLKLIHFMQRPIPASACDLGNWLYIIEVVSFLSVFCNAGLVVFTSNSVSDQDKVASFLIYVLFLLGMRYINNSVISPFPEQARLILARHKFVIDRIQRGISQGSMAYKTGYVNTTIDACDFQNVQRFKKDHIIKPPKIKVVNESP